MSPPLPPGGLLRGRLGLPVVFSTIEPPRPEEIVSELAKGYRELYRQAPEPEQVAAWRSSIAALLRELSGHGAVVLAEYPVFGGVERADFVVVASRRILVLEAKGHRRMVERSWLEAELDGDVAINPCLQAASYAEKIRYFHPAGRLATVEYAVFAYNSRPGMVRLGCDVVYTNAEPSLRSIVEQAPPDDRLVLALLEERMTVDIDVVKSLLVAAGGPDRIFEAIRSGGLEGGLPLARQAEIVREALRLYHGGERIALVIIGEAGSGKTVTALHLATTALSEGVRAVYATINSRLRAYLKTLLKSATRRAPALSYLVMPAYTRAGGVCHPRHSSAGDWDLVVVDEAQRLTVNEGGPLKGCMNSKARMVALFVDPSQVLLANEATLEDIAREAERSGRRIVQLTLPGPVRVPKAHLEMVRKLLYEPGKSGGPLWSPLEVRLYHTPSGYMKLRETLLRAWREGRRVAQVCAFTESRGDMKRWWRWSGPNVRIGYPLESGFDLYKGLGLRVKWLMESSEEYTLYWRGELDRLRRKYERRGETPPDPLTPADLCASVYGVQGFDAEVVGLVWGRDLVWRGDGWTANPGPITDYVGRRGSNLASLARRAARHRRALERLVGLLRNRYYIMLTRATRELHIFFEDLETARAVSRLTGRPLEGVGT